MSSKTDNLILAFLAGAILTATPVNDKLELEEYRRLKQIWNSRRNKLLSQDVTKVSEKLSNPELLNLFTEAWSMFVYGFPRGAAIFSSAVVENLLKQRYGGGKRFVELIEEAEREGVITEKEKHYLHIMRLERNDSVHELQAISDETAIIVFQIAVKLIQTFIDNKDVQFKK